MSESLQERTSKVFVNVEMDNGEGFVLKIEADPGTPVYHRWYLPLSDENDDGAWGRKLVASLYADKRAVACILNCEGNIVSVQAASVWDNCDELYKNKTIEEARELAASAKHHLRIVMEDGKPRPIGSDINPNRVNLHIAHNKVYRTERY